MYQYPKSIQTNEQLLNKWFDASMIIEPDYNAIEVLDTIGYYRLKGYSFHFYNKVTGRYQEGTSFSDRLCSEFSVNARFHGKTVHILRSSEPEAEAEPPPMAARSVLDRLA